ncbi:hypothetical protein [Turicibacter sanguinis]|uniref:hypothetical protein n=1 Tax=Turicibacter sanguinis TaxID=154288 RepID=UPI0006C698F0|nr:hypothetical protein [Turicibacter sanguinis]MDB8576359.1 hypothetical protein [Turicibacter sanguinis]MDB8579311.1 hypothetical protein [Turicibacter sanguinis]MDB8585050.1 hypothetical protein [Turicibacter sanguinis]MDB8588083.1 hypothetical protein [Turicibacter sanguinis]MDB8598813.1 hypothetical protein [Turicibacter sanguinis]
MRNIFTILVVLFPILSVYSSGIPNMSTADLLLIFVVPLILLEKFINNHRVITRYIKILRPICIFLLYLGVTLCIQVMIESQVEVLSTIRFMLYIIALIIGVEMFNFKLGLKILKYVTIIISIYTILQFTVFMLFHTTLPWRIPGLVIMDSNFIAKEMSEYYLLFYRPTGIFLEPTHLVQYIYVYLIYSLFSIQLNYKEALLISVAIVVSGSSLGMIVLLLIWGIWLLSVIGKKRILKKHIIIAIVIGSIVVVSIPYLLNLPYISKIFTRVIGDGSLNGAAVGYRFDSLTVVLDSNMPFIYRLIGYGRGTNTVYMTGIPYLIYCNGIIGLIIYLWIIGISILKNRGFFKILAIVVLFTSIGSEMIINFGILFYMMFIYQGYKKGNYKV